MKAHRARQAASGRQQVSCWLPADLVERIDQLKKQRGLRARAEVIEQELRRLIEAETRA
ncbi:ribbon-helix-helix protein, CopG family [Inquilinus sp. NPDC058860]|uniref:ribbon-helix-helix protein, CopG family n=1 Tax=Inquilinus sp. NPDC058860 TaxID=3346652 RepID=UPI0036B2D1AA